MRLAQLVERCGIAVLAMSNLAGCYTCMDLELRDAATGAPIEGARVTADPLYVLRLDRPQQVEGISDAQGMVALNDVGSTPHIMLKVYAPGYRSQQTLLRTPLPSTTDEWRRLESLLGAPGEIETRVVKCGQ